MKNIVKRLLDQTPWRLVRRGALNRFQGNEHLLFNLSSRGFAPSLVIDGGANVGDFARLARRIWPMAHIHMIEPQPACEPALNALTQLGHFSVQIAALGRFSGTLRLAASASSTSTGAHVVEDASVGDSSEWIEVPVTTLHDVLQASFAAEPILLKLDLQGYELHALEGSGSALDRIDVVLTEVSFYAQAYEPSIAKLVAFFDARSFDLHDIGALTGRRRDGRAHQADLLFVRRGSTLAQDTDWA